MFIALSFIIKFTKMLSILIHMQVYILHAALGQGYIIIIYTDYNEIRYGIFLCYNIPCIKFTTIRIYNNHSTELNLTFILSSKLF